MIPRLLLDRIGQNTVT